MKRVGYGTLRKQMFVSLNQLPFDLAALIEQAISDWSDTQPLGFTRPVMESCGDSIISEMEADTLRQLSGDQAIFNEEATGQDYRECVFAALDHWLVQAELSTKRTPLEMGEYRRPCGE